MGCDIHFYVEQRITDFDGKTDFWRSIDVWEESEDCSGMLDCVRESQFYTGRCYWLFAKMAGVRNYGGQIDPYCLPRGLPDDCSKVIRRESDRWGSDGHSHSFLTLDELKGMDWSYNGKIEPYGLPRIKKCIDRMLQIPTSRWRREVRAVFWFDN